MSERGKYREGVGKAFVICGCECEHTLAMAHAWCSEDHFWEVVLSSNHTFQGSKSVLQAPTANMPWSSIIVKLHSVLVAYSLWPNSWQEKLKEGSIYLGGYSPSWRSSQWLGNPHILLKQETYCAGQKWCWAITFKDLPPVTYSVIPISHPKGP